MMNVQELAENYFEVKIAKDNLTLDVKFLKNHMFNFTATQLVITNSNKDDGLSAHTKKIVIKGTGKNTAPVSSKVIHGASNIYNNDVMHMMIHVHHTFMAFFANKTIKEYENYNQVVALKNQKNKVLEHAHEIDKEIAKLNA